MIFIYSEKNKMFLMAGEKKKIDSLSGPYKRIQNVEKIK